jgi:Flp pilus assembly pilin Flp
VSYRTEIYGIGRHRRPAAVRGLREQQGETMTEYALLVALIALPLIAAIGVLTGGIDHVFSGAGQHLAGIAT